MTEGKRVVEERREVYGDAVANMQRLAGLWSSLLGVEVTASQACLMMIQLKITREVANHHPDNLVDIEGYTEILRQVRKEEAREDRTHSSGT